MLILILFWPWPTWHVIFRIQSWVFPDFIVLPGSKEMELGSSNHEASPSEDKNVGVSLSAKWCAEVCRYTVCSYHVTYAWMNVHSVVHSVHWGTLRPSSSFPLKNKGFSFFTPSYLLKVTQFLVKISKFQTHNHLLLKRTLIFVTN